MQTGIDLLKTLGFSSLEDKSVLITGASSGIGKETAIILAPFIKKLILVARRREKLNSLKDSLQNHCSIETFAGDICHDDFLSTLRTEGAFHCDILINNAGLARGLAHTVDAQISDWQEMIDTNITAAFKIAKAVLPWMLKHQSGHIVNLTSVASHTAYASGGVYCASKHALLAFAKALRSETCANNIRISNISPGMTETEFSLVRYHGDKEKAKSVYNDMLPLSGQDIARQILFCLLQPAHVNIDEIYITPTAQGEVTKVHRSSNK